ncbi:MAG TPA: NAD(P)/FAD-dependent oxidoreductase [Burkholderiaceae bacterium]|nr:NAD(P)/FAD-dependent oxidoreductase [Burkholderiaceae bacterium]
MSPNKQIVVVGGGFAGTTLVGELERRLPADYRIVLISEESYTTFNPMLAEVVGASVFPEHVVAPIRQMLDASRGSQFIMGRVTAVDRERRIVSASTLAGVREIPYEHLVLAFGTRANLDLVPGLAQHALPLKLVGDAMFIRNRVLQRVACIELEPDPRERARLGHFVVIGGGFSGVEVAGELADFLHGALRFYPRVQRSELRVTLLHDLDRLLPELPPALGHAAARSLAERGIDVRLGTRATEVTAQGVTLSNGDPLAVGTVICTIGTRPNPLVERLGVALQRGRIETDADLRVRGARDVWAIGDCALIRNHAADGAVAPPTAQFAIAQARQLARNIGDAIADRPTRAFSHVSKGMMATTGHLKGVARAYGFSLSGLPAWLLWRAYYLARMPTLGRKVRIWIEWTWGMFFAPDITHLRFTRTQDAEREALVP